MCVGYLCFHTHVITLTIHTNTGNICSHHVHGHMTGSACCVISCLRSCILRQNVVWDSWLNTWIPNTWTYMYINNIFEYSLSYQGEFLYNIIFSFPIYTLWKLKIHIVCASVEHLVCWWSRRVKGCIIIIDITVDIIIFIIIIIIIIINA